MSRLVDYFLVLGFDHSKQRGSVSNGKVLQRFPVKDWPDVPFIDGIELFCQPLGWRLSSHPQQPTFFVSVLTDVDANKHFCACLSFNEPIAIQPIKQPDDEDVYVDNIMYSNVDGTIHHSVMYAPKCLVLVSRHHYVEVFKNCLGIIYTVYIDCLDICMETLIGNLLACIEVPPPGGPQIRFSLGANDRQCLYPPSSSTVPVTGTTVYELFEQLGIHSVITLFTAATTEQKILFHSKSYSRLHDACHALASLMYPFHYSHVYIPILPSSLLEVLSTPTPFIMGVHSSLRNEVEDLLDVIIVDLDGGSITVPDCQLPKLDDQIMSQLVDQLCLVIRPQLVQADDAFSSSQLKPSAPFQLDKEIRAIFVRLFAQLLQGYRTCLQVVRIHPKPFITFHKSSFLGQRNLVENEFVVRLLECMFFNLFVKERGPPFRPSDLFDELYATMNDTLKREAKTPELVVENIRALARQLSINECPNEKDCFISKVPQPTAGAFTRIHQPTFPDLKSNIIEDIIENERIQKEMTRKPSLQISTKARIIPIGPRISSISCEGTTLITNSARRLEVMKNCVNCIFEKKISDARKTIPAVLRALKNKSARLALAEELSFHVSGNKAVLDHEQFDLVVRLINCALQQDCDFLDSSASGLRISGLGDVNGVAAAILPLSMTFCRRLSTGVIQYAYTCLQDHPVWSNHGFWEAVFFQDVEKAVTSLYVAKDTPADDCLQQTPLDIAAEQIRLTPKLNEEKIKEFSANEEATVYSQAVHFVHRMVSLKVPLDIGNHERNARSSKQHNNSLDAGQSDTNSNITGTGAGRESVREDFDNESGFEDGCNGKYHGTSSETSANVIKFLGRFVDKVCTEGGVTEDHIKSLHQIIPGIVVMQCDNVDLVYKESKKIPPITKPKIVSPDLLSGEQLFMQGLRVYLIADGREEVMGSSLASSGSSHAIVSPGGGPILLPAEGAIFLTNYRVIFRGRPCDPFASECPIVRSFPIATLTKEKRINIPSNYLIASIDQYVQEGLQLRSNTFQLIKVAFDEEVNSDAVESLRKLINRARTPPSIFQLYAFTSQVASNPLNLHKHKDKNATIRGFAKKTLLKTAAFTGIHVKNKYKRTKYFIPPAANGGSSKTMAPLIRSQLSTIDSIDERSLSDDMSTTSDSINSHVHSTTTLPPITPATPNISQHKEKSSATIKKLVDLSYVKDYERLNLGKRKDILPPNSSSFSPSVSKSSKLNIPDSIRISTVNFDYSVCQSYPAYVVVPSMTPDESIRKLSRCYKYHRFPTIVWRHPKTKCLLLRGSSFHGKGVIGMLKSHGSSGGNPIASQTTQQPFNESSANLEQEIFFRAIVSLTPSPVLRRLSSMPGKGSSMSIPSLTFSGPDSVGSVENVGENSVKDAKKQAVVAQFHRAINTLRSSGGKGAINSIGTSVGKQLQKFTSQPNKPACELDRVSSSSSITSSSCGSTVPPPVQPKELQTKLSTKVSLYIFGEKAQVKNLKTEQYHNCEFLPIEVHETRHTKQSFKKLLRACCPSASTTDPDQSFYKQIENSEWLNQLQTIMKIAVATVDIIDIQGASVMICLEDGWDIVPQIISVAEICLDPYYRTFEGFKVLIEKEWLAFGHRFSHRSNHTASTLTSGFAPIFLQFLDIVHQIMNQFPLAFEFNQYYLKFVAYHYVSCRFRTFLLDSETERQDYGWLQEDLKKKIDDDDYGYDFNDTESLSSANGTLTQSNTANAPFNCVGTSFWDYAEKIWSRSSVFYNFLYIPTSFHQEEEQSCVIRPFYNISSLRIWDYYLAEELSQGPSYDMEMVAIEKQRREEYEATIDKNGMQVPKRRVINAIYDSVEHFQENSIQLLLESIKSLETDFSLPKQKWSNIWNKTEIPLLSTKNLGKFDSVSKKSIVASQILRRYCGTTNKRSTLDLLLGGKLLDAVGPQRFHEEQSSLEQHKFEKVDFSPPVACDYCKHLVSGVMKCGLQCMDCGYNCHEKCVEFVAKECNNQRIISPLQSPVHYTNGGFNECEVSENLSPEDLPKEQNNHGTFFINHQTTSENSTHEGYLLKKGALLKNWKQRWYVLDSSKHQLRYYDSPADNHCKGFIDLAEVVSVSVNPSNLGSAVFDLKTVRRSYNFTASDGQAAQEWVEKIQGCLQ